MGSLEPMTFLPRQIAVTNEQISELVGTRLEGMLRWIKTNVERCDNGARSRLPSHACAGRSVGTLELRGRTAVAYRDYRGNQFPLL